MIKITVEQFNKISSDLKKNGIPTFRIKELVGDDDYYDWKFLIKNELISFDYFQFIESEFEDEVLNSNDFKRFDRITLALITTNVSVDIRRHLFYVKSAKEAWKLLIERFEGTTDLIKSLRLFEILKKATKNKNNDIDYTLSHFQIFANEMKSLFPDLEDLFLIGFLACIIPDKHPDLELKLQNKLPLSYPEAFEFIRNELLLDNLLSNSKDVDSNDRMKCKYCKAVGHNIDNCEILKAKKARNQ